MLKKIVSLMLCAVLIFSTGMTAFADNGKDEIYTKEVTVVDKGKTYNVTLSSNLPFEKEKRTERSLYPQEKVGTKRTFTVKIKSDDISAYSFISVTTLQFIARKAFEKAVPGLNIASAVAGAITTGLWAVGKKAIIIKAHCEYTQHYYNMGGYYVYSWRVNSVNVTTV